MKRSYSTAEAEGIAKDLNIDFGKKEFDLEQFHSGLNVEAEHGAVDEATNVTNDDLLAAGKIALAHLNEIPDYYTRLAKMEAEAKAALQARRKAKRGLIGRILPLALIAAAFLALRARAQRRMGTESGTAGSTKEVSAGSGSTL